MLGIVNNNLLFKDTGIKIEGSETIYLVENIQSMATTRNDDVEHIIASSGGTGVFFDTKGGVETTLVITGVKTSLYQILKNAYDSKKTITVNIAAKDGSTDLSGATFIDYRIANLPFLNNFTGDSGGLTIEIPIKGAAANYIDYNEKGEPLRHK